MMQDDVIYALTPRGEKELRSGETALSPDEIELLVRTDGVLTFGQIKAGIPNIASAVLTATLRRLLERKLLAVAEIDPFADQFQVQLNNMMLSKAGAEADACTLSLKKTGYYVSIARKRSPARTLKQGEILSAIVVDDEQMLARFIRSLLAIEGFNVRVAGNRAEVIAEFNRPPAPDLILLDVMLPDADGFDILLRLRQHPALRDVPVIMLTGKATREDVLKGLAGGADGYITKPVEADVLMHAVRTVVGLTDPADGKPGDTWVNPDARP